MRAASLACLVASLGLSGCAGYRLGPTNGQEAGNRSVQIDLFKNQTLEPRLSEPVAQALRERIHEDGTFRLATRGGADIVVTGTITGFNRAPLSFQPADVTTVRDYDAKLTVHVSAVERTSGRLLLDRNVTGRATIEGGPDMGSAERQAAPILAQDLARRIVSLLADGSW